MKKSTNFLIKLIISIFILVFIINKLDFNQIFEIKINWFFFLICMILGSLNIFICTFRWWYLNNKIYDIKTPFFMLFKLYLIGVFFNLFLPSSIGGDTIKSYNIYKYSNKKLSAIHAIFFDRLLGLIILSIFAIVGLTYILFFSNLIINSIEILLTFSIIILGFTLFLPFIGDFPIFSKLLFFKKLKEFFLYSEIIIKNKKKLLVPILMTFLFQFSCIIVSFIMSKAVGMNVNFIFFMAFIPISTIIILIPITFAGMGLREVSFVFLFSLIGVKAEEIILVPLLVFSINVILGLLGGVFYIKEDFKNIPKNN
ncbi:MAG: lysylphosphatidylglycerol synthase transmembrane domain-containing protein [Candidatus Nanoarchaeia archaeon]|jgi:hypothetical protein